MSEITDIEGQEHESFVSQSATTIVTIYLLYSDSRGMIMFETTGGYWITLVKKKKPIAFVVVNAYIGSVPQRRVAAYTESEALRVITQSALSVASIDALCLAWSMIISKGGHKL